MSIGVLANGLPGIVENLSEVILSLHKQSIRSVLLLFFIFCAVLFDCYSLPCEETFLGLLFLTSVFFVNRSTLRSYINDNT